MTRHALRLAASGLLLVGLLCVELAPATAHVADVCIGNGTATTDNPVFYPVTPGYIRGDVDGRIAFSFALGGCLLGPVLSSTAHSGTVYGDFEFNPAGVDEDYCGHSTGHIDAWGHGLDWVSAGSLLYLEGRGRGVVNAIPNALGPDGSCFTGAKNFLVTGVLVIY